MIRFCTGCVLAFSTSVPVQAEPVSLQPSSPWHINYADDSCRMLRIFGEERDQVILAIDQFQPGDSFQLMLASKLLTRARASYAKPRKVSLRFGPGEGEQSLAMRAIEFQKTPGLMATHVMFGVQEDEEKGGEEVAAAKAADDKKKLSALDALVPVKPMTSAREAAVTYLAIAGASRDPIRLETGPFDKSMAALRACTDDLLNQWGVDAKAHKSLIRKAMPKGNPGTWVSSNDYPTHLVASGTQGLIQFRLSIDETGKVSNCHIQQSTRPAEFDRTVCRIMMTRARFDPALDSDGKPIKSYWRSSFAFLMPN